MEYIFLVIIPASSIVLLAMALYSAKVKRDIVKLQKQNEYLDNMRRNKVAPQVYQAPKRHGKAVVSKHAIHQQASRMHRTTQPEVVECIINPTTVVLAAALLSSNDTPASEPDCSPSDSGSFDSGSSSCDSGGGDFGGGN